MNYFLLLLLAVVLIISAMFFINNFIIKKSSSNKAKTIFKSVTAIIISMIAGGLGFFLIFLLGEGLVEVISGKMSLIATFGGLSLYNFIVCIFIGKFYKKSFWFSGFLINITVWSVLIFNLKGPGGFVDLWYGWTAMVLFAFAGSFTGSMLLKKKVLIDS